MGFARSNVAKEFSNWVEANSYTLAEAALILLKQNPNDWPNTKELLVHHPDDFTIHYQKLIEHANARICQSVISMEDMHGAVVINDDGTISILTGFRLLTNRDWLGADITIETGLDIRVGNLELQNWAKQQDGVRIIDGKAPQYQHFYANLANQSDISKELQQIKDAIDRMYPGELLSIPRGGKKGIKGCLCPPMSSSEFEKHWRKGTDRGIFKTKSHEGYGKKECWK